VSTPVSVVLSPRALEAAASPASPFVARRLPGLAVPADGVAATPFQEARWLRAWSETAGKTEALETFTIRIEDRAGRPVMYLPMMLSRQGGLRAVTFADAGVTDYNLPHGLARKDWTRDELAALWKAIVSALPPADVLRLEKMPERIGALPNPLALHARARPMELAGACLAIGEDYASYGRGLERHDRKEIERSWRVFERIPGTSFRRVTEQAEADRVMACLERWQRERMAALGKPYILDQPSYRALYRRLVAYGLADGQLVLTALMRRDEPVAALLSIASGNGIAMLRIADAGGDWKTCSPGRLIIERTMRHLHAEGYRSFDMTTGAYDYKRRLGAETRHLVELVLPLSLAAWPAVLAERAKHWLKDQSWVNWARRQVARRSGTNSKN
jgi:CelD/BcsL family acetyltransferase involved in cellulose biosynthesis